MGCTHQETATKTKENVVPNKKPENDEEVYENKEFKPLIQYSDPKKQLKESQKELIEKIVKEAPPREKSNLQSLNSYFTSKSQNLQEVEKAWLIFRWIGENIKYDYPGMLNGTAIYDEEGVIKIGATICEGYSRLYKNFGDNLGLTVEKIAGYGKGAGFKINRPFTDTNHAWNILTLNGNQYFIEATWGSGYVNNGQYFQRFEPFYFCPNPSLFIFSHLPEDPKYQLLKKNIDMEKFMSIPLYKPLFFTSGMKQIIPEKSIFKITENTGKFEISYNPKKEIYLMGNIYYLKGNTYYQQNESVLITKYKDKFLVEFITNNPGEYKLTIFAKSSKDKKNYDEACQLMIICESTKTTNLRFPNTYELYHYSDFELISPKYNDLAMGQSVDFRVKTSDFNLIKIVNNNDWIDMEKKEGNIFEKKGVVINANTVSLFTKKGDSEGKYNGILSFTNIPCKPN